jgi:DNA-binding response OmpR family regulator
MPPPPASQRSTPHDPGAAATRAVRVLVIDDEPKIRQIVRGYLEADGFEVREAADGPAGLRAAVDTCPDLIVLDVMLPGLDGIEVLRRLRMNGDVPVILLTSRSEEIDKVVGLSVGADDYLAKPFGGRELVARLRAILRRMGRTEAADSSEPVLRFQGLTIAPDRREVCNEHGLIELSALNFDLLLVLASSPGRVYTRRQLLEAVWGHDYFGDDRVIDVHIRTLRRSLGDSATDPTLIGTVRGVGYRLLASPSA